MINEIYLVGEIGSEVTLATVLKQVQASDKTQPLNVHIHSGGGSVYDGIAIYNLLKSLPQEVYNLVKQLDDEAHRFAITYHKKLRKNNLLK